MRYNGREIVAAITRDSLIQIDIRRKEPGVDRKTRPMTPLSSIFTRFSHMERDVESHTLKMVITRYPGFATGFFPRLAFLQ
jgi:hypothetical protein